METTQLLTLPWGREQIHLNLPGTWKIDGVLTPGEVPPAAME